LDADYRLVIVTGEFLYRILEVFLAQPVELIFGRCRTQI
jgi:hypothetical protein